MKRAKINNWLQPLQEIKSNFFEKKCPRRIMLKSSSMKRIVGLLREIILRIEKCTIFLTKYGFSSDAHVTLQNFEH